MNNLLKRTIALVGGGIFAVVVFLLATVGFVIALGIIAVLIIVALVAARRNGGRQFVVFTNRRTDVVSPSLEKPCPPQNRGAEPVYDLPPEDYTSRNTTEDK